MSKTTEIIVVTVDGGCAYADDPRVLIVDYDNLESSVREEVDADVLAWLEENDPSNIPPTRAEAFAGSPEAQEAERIARPLSGLSTGHRSGEKILRDWLAGLSFDSKEDQETQEMGVQILDEHVQYDDEDDEE